MYICVVNRLGTLVGVIHLVNGIRESVSSLASGEWDFRTDICLDHELSIRYEVV